MCRRRQLLPAAAAAWKPWRNDGTEQHTVSSGAASASWVFPATGAGRRQWQQHGWQGEMMAAVSWSDGSGRQRMCSDEAGWSCPVRP